jgi:hypothetical protein
MLPHSLGHLGVVGEEEIGAQLARLKAIGVLAFGIVKLQERSNHGPRPLRKLSRPRPSTSDQHWMKLLLDGCVCHPSEAFRSILVERAVERTCHGDEQTTEAPRAPGPGCQAGEADGIEQIPGQ